jgi:catechol-2,3-dioxygenase
MKITELTLQTTQVEQLHYFYEHVLELPLLNAAKDSFTVQVGETRLAFERNKQTDLLYHFAFTIPSDALPQARPWLAARDLTLLKSPAGEDEFAFGNWNADSIYFHDPAGNILELIAHHELPDQLVGAFSSRHLLRVGEIGMVVDDVLAQVTRLQQELGITSQRDELSETFSPVGDAHGRFIVVKTARAWWPTLDERAVISPVHVTIKGTQAQHYQVGAYPYSIDVTVS